MNNSKSFDSAQPKKGFSLIELLVVISIIGILASIIYVNLLTARQRSRDTKRLADVAQLQLVLALYLDKYGQYPSALADPLIIQNGFIGVIPTDPLDQTSYFYTPLGTINGSTCYVTGYHLGTDLELSNAAMQTDAKAAAIPVGSNCTGMTDFSGAGPTPPGCTGNAGRYCYDLKK